MKNAPVRVVLFGSFYRGHALLERLLELQEEHPSVVKLVGVATDDPSARRVSPDKRVWQYVTDPREESMVKDLARRNGVTVWEDGIKTQGFLDLFESWAPDIGYMATFGQRVPARIFDRVPLGFYNFHPCVDRAWPSYVGGNPFQAMIDQGEIEGALAFHQIDEDWDHGELAGYTKPFPITFRDTVVSLHKKTAPLAASVMSWHLADLLGLPHSLLDYAPRPLARILAVEKGSAMVAGLQNGRTLPLHRSIHGVHG